MKAVFADTFFFFAILNRADPLHARATAFSRNSRVVRITTDWVITELADGLCAVANRPLFTRLLNIIRGGSTTVVPFDAGLMDRGLALFAERADKDWSLTDCISFVVMQEYGILEALTADHHFEQAGFVALLR